MQQDEIIDRDEVLKMARQAQVYEELCGEHFIYEFAKLVSAKEREACAKVCDEQEFDYWRSSEDQEWTPQDCAKAIRARSFATSRGEA